MELNVIDRIYIPTILPTENTFMDFNMKREIIKKVALTAEDAKTYNIQEDVENKRTTWDINKDRENPLVVDFSKQELEYLKAACEKLADKPAPDNLWATVEKIYAAVQASA
jgi:hypothetical protein